MERFHLAFFIFSIVACGGGILYFLLAMLLPGHLAQHRISPFEGMLIGGTAAIFSIFLCGNLCSGYGPFYTLLRSAHSTLLVFLAQAYPADMAAIFFSPSPPAESVFDIYFVILHLLGPALLAGFALSFFQNAAPKIRFFLFAQGEVFAFSNPTSRSLALAEAIRYHQPKAILVFAADALTPLSPQIEQALHSVNAYVFPAVLSELNIPRRCKKLTFFVLTNSEIDNLSIASDLASRYRDKRAVSIYVESTQSEAATLLDAINRGTQIPVTLRLIHPSRLVVYSLLETVPLFLGMRGDTLSILIVGLGSVGTEALKAICWCGQLLHSSPTIYVIEKDASAQGRFFQQCPELAPDSSSRCGSAGCTIEFYSLDAETDSLETFLQNHRDIGYVICTLGEDFRSLKCALEMQRTMRALSLEQPGQKPPLINVRLLDPFLARSIQTLSGTQNDPEVLHAFGSLSQLYNWELIYGSYLEQLSFRVHCAYEGLTVLPDYGALTTQRQSYESCEYNRQSNLAVALHLKYKLFCCPPLAQNAAIDWHAHPTQEMLRVFDDYLFAADCPDDTERAQASAARIETFALLEHRRWNAFMRICDWRQATDAQIAGWWALGNHTQKDPSSRLHTTIVPWESLDDISALLFEKYNWKNGHLHDFKESDIAIVQRTAEILHVSPEQYAPSAACRDTIGDEC